MFQATEHFIVNARSMKGRLLRRSWIGGAILISLLALFAASLPRFRKSAKLDSQVLVEAGIALQHNRPAEALQQATTYLRQVPQSAAARYVAGQAAERLGRREEALQLLQGVSKKDGSDAAVDAAVLAGNLNLDSGRAWDAEQCYRHALSHRPRDVTANRKLVFLLTVEGRRWESRPHLLELVGQRQNNLEELLILGALWSDYELVPELDRFRKERPDDPLPLLGLARVAARKQDFSEALRLLEPVIEAYPSLVEAHAWLGFAHLQTTNGTAELTKWDAALPPAASEHPMIWLVRGMGAEQLGQKGAAIRCFGEALSRDASYELAAFRLSRALAAVDDVENSAILLRRTNELFNLAARLRHLHKDGKGGIQSFREVAQSLDALGRIPEAAAWYSLVQEMDSSHSWASEEAARLHELAASQKNSRSLVKAESALKLDLAKYPLPQWPKMPAAAITMGSALSHVRFVDAAADAGIEFSYFNGDEPGDARLLGTTGGGVAVVDYDGDGWPDIYFAQGTRWPVHPAATSPVDKLFRNLGNGKFEDVTLAAGLGDGGYSQGVAAGDFDNDGFADLYLANLGVNRLYHNNGDGTFTDIALQAGITRIQWTTSCLIADVSGDGLPDLYDVNYVEGDALTRRCPGGPCAPHLFPGEADRLLLNLGDGEFRDISRLAQLTGKNGKGLGIVAADFTANGKLSLFVANDGTANFFYENVTPDGDPVPRFVENGTLSGLAYDRNGVAQASMGVAADDATGDGHIDLFVTNFYDDANTFYVPEASGRMYRDQTVEFGLRESSLRLLGFGTQFIDGDLDGWRDLILTNGHVQDHTKVGIPYKMRAQYYHNLEGKAFQELHADTLGPFFDQLLLGRGLARLDWNRDGREDVAISHIGSPAALLTNQTSPAGHFLTLQLRGITGSRDAIGTIVRLKCNGRTLTRQLTAGDGYQASNQRQLVFGLGDSTQNAELEIRWPGGATQTFTDVAVDAEYIAVEARGTLVKCVSSAKKK